MGAVYLALDTAAGRQVALKLVPCGDARWRERFQREGQAAAALDHPHVVRVHAAGEVRDAARDVGWIAQEYLPGGSLQGLLERRGRLSWREAATLGVVPTLLLNERQVDDLLDELEARYLSNKDPNLHFALLTDHPDTASRPGDPDEGPLADRPALNMRAVAISALLILLFEPESVIEPSFQMSFAAIIGLIALAEWHRNRERDATPDPSRFFRALRHARGGSFPGSARPGHLEREHHHRGHYVYTDAGLHRGPDPHPVHRAGQRRQHVEPGHGYGGLRAVPPR